MIEEISRYYCWVRLALECQPLVVFCQKLCITVLTNRSYYLAHSARADMYGNLGRTAEAPASYEKALALTQQEPERQFLQERIRQLK